MPILENDLVGLCEALEERPGLGIRQEDRAADAAPTIIVEEAAPQDPAGRDVAQILGARSAAVARRLTVEALQILLAEQILMGGRW